MEKEISDDNAIKYAILLKKRRELNAEKQELEEDKRELLSPTCECHSVYINWKVGCIDLRIAAIDEETNIIRNQEQKLHNPPS